MGSAALKEALKLPLVAFELCQSKVRPGVVRISAKDGFESFSRLSLSSGEGVDLTQVNAGAHQAWAEAQSCIQTLGCPRITLLTDPNGSQCGPAHGTCGRVAERQFRFFLGPLQIAGAHQFHGLLNVIRVCRNGNESMRGQEGEAKQKRKLPTDSSTQALTLGAQVQFSHR